MPLILAQGDDLGVAAKKWASLAQMDIRQYMSTLDAREARYPDHRHGRMEIEMSDQDLCRGLIDGIPHVFCFLSVNVPGT